MSSMKAQSSVGREIRNAIFMGVVIILFFFFFGVILVSVRHPEISRWAVVCQFAFEFRWVSVLIFVLGPLGGLLRAWRLGLFKKKEI